MGRIAYVNGRYLPHGRAGVHIEDRGYQFADSVYEVIAVHGGHLVDEEAHLDRLERSLSETRMAWPMARRAMRVVIRRMICRNRITDRGMVYLQVTRGVAPRDHAFPASPTSSLVMTARILPPINPEALRRGVSVITTPDLRWKRTDIKSTSLLPNVLARQQAIDVGADDAWMLDPDGNVTEGSASNAWIVGQDGSLTTRQADWRILKGVTRRVILRIAAERHLRINERPFSVAEVKVAAEAFMTSTTSLLKPVVRIDGVHIGDGKIGPVSAHLLRAYMEHLEEIGAGAQEGQHG
ncbi:MAG: D-amino-acid transaminase [Rhodospirillales bacterium]|nr:D-amino-acid transaminase [Rhodospirillales bacterium]